MKAPEERVYFALDRSLDHALMGLVLAIGVQALPRDPHAMISCYLRRLFPLSSLTTIFIIIHSHRVVLFPVSPE